MKYINVFINLKLESESPRSIDAIGEVLLALNRIELRPGESVTTDATVKVERLIP